MESESKSMSYLLDTVISSGIFQQQYPTRNGTSYKDSISNNKQFLANNVFLDFKYV